MLKMFNNMSYLIRVAQSTFLRSGGTSPGFYINSFIELQNHRFALQMNEGILDSILLLLSRYKESIVCILGKARIS